MHSKMAAQIALDGPVGSGKTAAGQLLARRLGHLFLDTGLMYRAITALALRRGVSPDDGEALGCIAESVPLAIETGPEGEARILANGVDLGPELRAPGVERCVSAVSTVARVRTALVAQQRELARRGPIVMVGRDIGTVVLADADLKVYLDATPATRARRRYLELRDAGRDVTYEEVLENVRLRDGIDSTRDVAPLRAADDARVLDTDTLTLDEVVGRLEAMAREGPGLDRGARASRGR